MFLYAIALIAVYVHIKCPLYIQEPWFNIHKVIREKKSDKFKKKNLRSCLILFWKWRLSCIATHHPACLIARPDDPEVYKGYGAIFALTGILN